MCSWWSSNLQRLLKSSFGWARFIRMKWMGFGMIRKAVLIGSGIHMMHAETPLRSLRFLKSREYTISKYTSKSHRDNEVDAGSQGANKITTITSPCFGRGLLVVAFTKEIRFHTVYTRNFVGILVHSPLKRLEGALDETSSAATVPLLYTQAPPVIHILLVLTSTREPSSFSRGLKESSLPSPWRTRGHPPCRRHPREGCHPRR